MPRILYTFFDTYDLSGKTIAPFRTGGSEIGKTAETLREIVPNAKVDSGKLDTAELKEWANSFE